MDALLTAVRRYRILHAAILAYVGGCALWSLSVGAQGKFLPFMYVPACLILLALIAAVRLAAAGLHALRLGEVRARLRGEAGQWLAGFAPGALLCLSLTLLHGTYTSVKTIAPDVISFRTDTLLADLDHAIHGHDAWQLLTWLNPLTDLLQPLYSAVWLLLVGAVTALVVLAPISDRLKAHYAWTFTLCWVLLGNLLSSLMLAAGPAYYAEVTGSHRYDALTAYLGRHAGAFSAHDIQTHLWTAYADRSVGLASGISAFPSMHVSIATLFVLIGFKLGRSVGLGFLAYAALILLGSVHLGWHYAVDGYFSIAATIVIWKAVAWGLDGFPRLFPAALRVPRLAGLRS
jgi:hypothetical protein